VVDRATGEPINGARIELMERNKRRSVSMTSPQGKSANKVERGKYLALVSKDAYKKAEQELYFEKGSGLHVVYLDRNEPYSERELAIAIDARWVDTEHGNPRRPSTIPIGIEMSELRNEELQSTIQPASKEPEVGVLDLGINSNKQWNEVEIATSSDSRWEDLEQIKIEPEELVAPDVVVHSIVKPNVKEKPVEEFDLGINHNNQWEDVAELDTEPIIDERVEAALASAENKQESEVNQKPDLGSYPAPEPEFSKKTYRPNNILLLLDVSGSMKEEEKMVKLKKSVRRLVMMLREVDVLTIIAYNSSSWEVLPPTLVENNEEIVSLIDSLQPNGYTNGVKGMAAAYESLYEQLIQDGNNQLIIATDGKFNSSKFSEKEAIQMVKNNSDKGITLSIIGFGEDREATKLMKRLAKEGGGNLLQINKNQNPTELLTEEIKNRSRKL
jgi:Mg-chelatase subunit ChlD